jgi:hypothetical protein
MLKAVRVEGEWCTWEEQQQQQHKKPKFIFQKLYNSKLILPTLSLAKRL